eukprot:3962909-Lingulodinium_polyedra.AAC.1
MGTAAALWQFGQWVGGCSKCRNPVVVPPRQSGGSFPIAKPVALPPFDGGPSGHETKGGGSDHDRR